MIAVVFVCIAIAGLLCALVAVRGRTALELRVPRALTGIRINVSALRGVHTPASTAEVSAEASESKTRAGPDGAAATGWRAKGFASRRNGSSSAPSPEEVERAVRERLYGSRRRPS